MTIHGAGYRLPGRYDELLVYSHELSVKIRVIFVLPRLKLVAEICKQYTELASLLKVGSSIRVCMDFSYTARQYSVNKDYREIFLKLDWISCAFNAPYLQKIKAIRSMRSRNYDHYSQ